MTRPPLPITLLGFAGFVAVFLTLGLFFFVTRAEPIKISMSKKCEVLYYKPARVSPSHSRSGWVALVAFAELPFVVAVFLELVFFAWPAAGVTSINIFSYQLLVLLLWAYYWPISISSSRSGWVMLVAFFARLVVSVTSIGIISYELLKNVKWVTLVVVAITLGWPLLGPFRSNAGSLSCFLECCCGICITGKVIRQ